MNLFRKRLGLLCIFWTVSVSSFATERYSLSGDGQEVTDNQTGLIWRHCAEGMRFTRNTCTGTYKKYTHEAALKQATTERKRTGVNWRLPNVKELSSLVDRGQTNPAINTTVFPVTPSEWFWSSSPYVDDANAAWDVSFFSGDVYTGGRNLTNPIRLIRDGQ